jgi:hypothetical protein
MEWEDSNKQGLLMLVQTRLAKRAAVTEEQAAKALFEVMRISKLSLPGDLVTASREILEHYVDGRPPAPWIKDAKRPIGGDAF